MPRLNREFLFLSIGSNESKFVKIYTLSRTVVPIVVEKKHFSEMFYDITTTRNKFCLPNYLNYIPDFTFPLCQKNYNDLYVCLINGGELYPFALQITKMNFMAEIRLDKPVNQYV